MPTLPAEFESYVRRLVDSLERVDGFLSRREAEFLCLLAACPTAVGEILEIGSYRGKSAILLAGAAALADSCRVALVDPLPCVGPMIPDSQGTPSARALLESNLRRAGVLERVDIHQAFSHELGRSWGRPLRLLWIDGDHSYDGARLDFATFSPFLADGAIVACHDILNIFPCTQAFLEDVLESPHFAAVGLCGSIGWGQYFREPSASRSARFSADKRKLARRLRPLTRFDREATLADRMAKLRYRVRRWFVPHAAPSPRHWLRQVA